MTKRPVTVTFSPLFLDASNVPGLFHVAGCSPLYQPLLQWCNARQACIAPSRGAFRFMIDKIGKFRCVITGFCNMK
jgi:hypothetical protein